MKLINKTENNLCHMEKDTFYVLNVGEVKDIPEKVAKVWLALEGISVYVDAADLEKAKEEAAAKDKAKIIALEKEVEKLKAAKTTKTTKTTKTKKTK